METGAYWKGYLRLSLVTCPIELFPGASQAEKTHFHQINTQTGHRLRQQMVDEETGHVVDAAHKGRGYELTKRKILNGVLAALAQGLVSLGEATEAIDLIERCRRIIGPAMPPAGSLCRGAVRLGEPGDSGMPPGDRPEENPEEAVRSSKCGWAENTLATPCGRCKPRNRKPAIAFSGQNVIIVLTGSLWFGSVGSYRLPKGRGERQSTGDVRH